MPGRILAILVMIASAGTLAWHHRADLLPGPSVPEDPAEAAYRACIAERASGIETMQKDGTINTDQATLFLSRAEALCRSQSGG